jgi:hypothetical protein
MQIIALIALFVAAASAISVTIDVESSFTAFKLKYNKSYLSAVRPETELFYVYSFIFA